MAVTPASTSVRVERADEASASLSAPPRRRSTWSTRLRRDLVPLLLMTPAVLYFTIFHYGSLFGNAIAFKDYVPFLGLGGSQWVGLANFVELFGDPAFWHAAWNTVSIGLLQLIFFFPAPLALALLLHSLAGERIKRFVQSVVYLPHFISWVIVVALFQQILGDAGVLNGFLGDSGLSTVDVIGNPDAYRPLVIAQVIWKECGWGTIIFLAALSHVDEQLYEASAMDGAGAWRRFWHVTLPSLRAVIILLLILRLGEFLSIGFEQFWLQRDAVGSDAGEVLETFVYFAAWGDGRFGYGAAAGIFKGVIGLILVFSANKIAHRLGEQGVYKS